MKECEAKVWVPETYRRTGRTTKFNKSGFEMHFTERRCKRTCEGRHCWQHQDAADRLGNARDIAMLGGDPSL